MKTLYKLDSKGKIREWNIYTKGSELIQTAGLLQGNLVKHSKVCTSKNVGKSNETTPSEQAKLELESEVKSKLDEGYFSTIEEAQSEEVILPMLAKSYGDYSHKIDWDNAYVQVKLDGMRCLAIIKNNKVILKSRDGKIIENMNHIIKLLSHIKSNIILDGELYCHGNTFQENMRLIKKYRKGETETICYHVYDTIVNKPFELRDEILRQVVMSCGEGISLVKTNQIKSEKELKEFHIDNLACGYEGSILRHSIDGYKIGGRSSSLLKYKDFQDIDCKIIAIEPAEQRPEQGVPVFKLKGKEFRAGMKYSHADREEFLTNKKNYIGKIANIRFFEYTDDGIPRFPVMIGIHGDR